MLVFYGVTLLTSARPPNCRTISRRLTATTYSTYLLQPSITGCCLLISPTVKPPCRGDKKQT